MGTSKTVNLGAIVSFQHYITNNGAPFSTDAALAAHKPNGEAGDFALVLSTVSFWFWNTDTNSWANSDHTGAEAPANYRDFNVLGVDPASPEADKLRVYFKDGNLTWIASDGLRGSLTKEILKFQNIQPSLIYLEDSAYSSVENNGEFTFSEEDEFTFYSLFKVLKLPTISSNGGAVLMKGAYVNSYGLYISNEGGNLMLNFGIRGTSTKIINREIGIEEYIWAFGVYKGEQSFLYLNDGANGVADLSNSGCESSSALLCIGNNNVVNGNREFVKLEVVKSGIFNKGLTQGEILDLIKRNGEVSLYKKEGSNVNLLEGFDFTSGWGFAGSGEVNDANSFTTTDNGGVFKSMLVKGNSYRVTNQGVTTATSCMLYQRDSSGAIEEIGLLGERHEFEAIYEGLYVRNIGAGTTDLSSFRLNTVGETWSTNQQGRGSRTDVDTSKNGGHLTHHNVRVSGNLLNQKQIIKTESTAPVVTPPADCYVKSISIEGERYIPNFAAIQSGSNDEILPVQAYDGVTRIHSRTYKSEIKSHEIFDGTQSINFTCTNNSIGGVEITIEYQKYQ
jgi:hypothetical protein